MAPFFHYWWAVLIGTVGVPLVGGAFWKQISLAHARWVVIHSSDGAKRQRAERVLNIEGPGAPQAPGMVAPPGFGCACPSSLPAFGTQVRIPDPASLPASPPDARHASPGDGWKERRYAPRHAPVWVRIGGEWRKGRIVAWVRQIDRAGWDVVIVAGEPSPGPPWQGRYLFDPASIRPRHTSQPPA
jgi:hypothetical protein